MVRFDLIPLDGKGLKRVNVQLQGPHVSGFPLGILTTFFGNLNQCTMKHVCCSDLSLPREDSLPYSIREVDVSLCMFIASATNSGKVLPNDNNLHIVNML